MVQEKGIFDWIDMILKRNNFKTLDVAEGIEDYIKELEKGKLIKYALYQSVGMCIQYLLILDIGDIKISSIDLGIEQRKIYKSLLELGDILEPEFDKNVSLLLCVDNSAEEENLEKKILEIEEDPYCFKKFVLTYSQKEIEFLEKQTDRNAIWNYMQQVVVGLREGEINFSDIGIKFIMKLYIKLPFLPADIAKQQEKPKLMEEIENSLEEKYRGIWESIKDMDIKGIEEIKDYTEEQIDSLLNKWYVEEE